MRIADRNPATLRDALLLGILRLLPISAAPDKRSPGGCDARRRPAQQESNFLRRNDMRIACAAFALLLAAFPARAQNVKITPIGSHPSELCANDRAIIFER